MQRTENDRLPARRRPRPPAGHGTLEEHPIGRLHPWKDAWRVQRVGIEGEYNGGEAASQLVSGLLRAVALAGLFVLGLVARALGAAFGHKS